MRLPRSMPEDLIKAIDRLLGLPPAGVGSARDYVGGVNSICSGLLEVLGPGPRGELAELVAEFEAEAAKLLRSLANLSSREMRPDWMRLAGCDLLKLKDAALALREFLTLHAEAIKRAWERATRADIGLEDLIKRLRSERAVSEQTWALLARYAERMGARSKELRDPAVLAHLARISCLLSGLKEAGGIAQTG